MMVSVTGSNLLQGFRESLGRTVRDWYVSSGPASTIINWEVEREVAI
jgi:hypothetical protein